MIDSFGKCIFGVGAATFAAIGCGGRATEHSVGYDAGTGDVGESGADGGAGSGGWSDGTVVDVSTGDDAAIAEAAVDDGAISPKDSSSSGSRTDGGGDGGFPSAFARVGGSDAGLAFGCPSAQWCYGSCCDPTAVCVDNGTQYACAKVCTNIYDCPASTAGCCTLLVDGTGACISMGARGAMPGQQCICAGGPCPGGPMNNTCAPAADNAGNATGPDVCTPKQ
jgi:hypothetical protein